MQESLIRFPVPQTLQLSFTATLGVVRRRGVVVAVGVGVGDGRGPSGPGAIGTLDGFTTPVVGSANTFGASVRAGLKSNRFVSCAARSSND